MPTVLDLLVKSGFHLGNFFIYMAITISESF
jgi:hypothetical protein